MATIKIGLLGFGNVGSGTYQILEMNKKEITDATGADVIVSGILVNDVTKQRDCDMSLVTNDVNKVIMESDIIVEVLGGIEPATTYMLKAMKAGKSVVTANKAAVAANFDELHKTAEDFGVAFRFEAAVGGAIPILNTIQTVLKGNKLTEIMGIVNGTTNYILTKMDEENWTYEEALKKAQELGFAEADPTADVEGIDVANKLSILMTLAFGKYVKPEDIPTVGISAITAEDIKSAQDMGFKIKLIAKAKMAEDGSIEYSVAPTVLPGTHPLATVSNEFNAVYVTGNASGELMFYGRGAGPLPTGSAVVGDIIEIAKFM